MQSRLKGHILMANNTQFTCSSSSKCNWQEWHLGTYSSNTVFGKTPLFSTPTVMGGVVTDPPP